jgi:hypothetical protein
MPEYIVRVDTKEVLSGFELSLLEARVKNFFLTNEERLEDNPTEVKAEYR